MNIKKIAAISVVSLSLLGAGSVVVLADGGWKKGGNCHNGHVAKRISNKLDLNESQAAELDELMVEFKEFRQAMFKGKKEAKSELAELLNAPQFDREKALALMVSKAQNKAGVVESQAPDLIDAIAEFTDSLNPEQRAKAVKFIERKMGHGHGGKGHHSGERSS
ncbi:MAG: periplasmic heavy metal sensor [Gammaproteobacteria bacterium]|nr:periplasmic heavy metal sensor [Gammaproteobacteria bacterium]